MEIDKIQKKIAKIKREIVLIGDMRPGSISKQYSVCGKVNCRCADPDNPKKHGPYYQLSYVHEGRSTSRFIKPQFLAQIKKETLQYKKFRALVDSWIDLAITASHLRIEQKKLEELKREKREA